MIKLPNNSTELLWYMIIATIMGLVTVAGISYANTVELAERDNIVNTQIPINTEDIKTINERLMIIEHDVKIIKCVAIQEDNVAGCLTQ